MNRTLKRVLIGVGAVVGVVAVAGGGYVWTQISAFDESVAKVYSVPPFQMVRSTDPAVLARGKHLSEAVVPCASSDCHGKDLAGGKTIELGPLGTMSGPNVTPAGLGAAYDDGELGRLLQHGIKKDGRTVLFMPSHDWSWLPPSDIIAIVSYVRTVPPVERANGPFQLGALIKILDRRGEFPIDVARVLDHEGAGRGPEPSATKEYGAYLVRLCKGCHGPGLSGGPIPGAPPDFPAPSNLTPHETGLKGWTFEDFDKLLTTAIRKNGQKAKDFMPTEAFGKLDSDEKHALFAYLSSVPPQPYGGR